MENAHTMTDLYQMQSLPLRSKIIMTKQRIQAWYDYFDGDVYVSFSGGKDSTVLVDLVHNVCGLTDVPLVYIDTGLEYPELRNFVKSYGDKVTWIKPKKNFKEVITEYGYPFISKEVSESVGDARNTVKKQLANKLENETPKQAYTRMVKSGDIDINSIPYRTRNLLGWNESNGKASIEPVKKSFYCCEKYEFLLGSEIKFHSKCCDVMKKGPAKTYGKETGRKPMTATMASESRLRTLKWLKNGCNGFNMKSPISNPMSFWTEQDVLLYIKENNLPIASVYGDIVEDVSGTEEVQGQLTMSDVWEGAELFDAKRPLLKTTGAKRTGCIFCGYGCHLEKPGEGRFEMLKVTHPKIYEYIFKPEEEGGLGYKRIIDWLNENGNLNIRY